MSNLINAQQAMAGMFGTVPTNNQQNNITFDDLPAHVKNQIHPPKIWETLNLVQSDLSEIGIAKTGFNSHQKYKYRSIDEVFNVLSGILAKRKLNIRTVTDPTHSRIEYSQDSKGVTKARALLYLIFIFTAEDGSSTDARFFVEGYDSSDKAANKAYSAGYKQMASHTFSIPFDVVDSEDERHEVKHEPINQPDFVLSVEDAEHLIMMKDNLKINNLKGAAECAVSCSIPVSTLVKDRAFTNAELQLIRLPEFRDIMMELKKNNTK